MIAAATLAPRATEARLVPLDRPALLLADRAEQIFATGLCLPSGSSLSEDDQGRIIAAVHDVLGPPR